MVDDLINSPDLFLDLFKDIQIDDAFLHHHQQQEEEQQQQKQQQPIETPSWIPLDFHEKFQEIYKLWTSESRLVWFSKKKLLTPDEMNSKQLKTYNKLLVNPKKLDEDIQWLKSKSLPTLIGVTDGNVSRRIIDALMSKVPKLMDCHYYIDVTDPNDTKYLPREAYHEYMSKNPQAQLVLKSVSNCYRQSMSQHSKTFFDVFERGDNVIHQFQDSGEWTCFSMCNLLFFRWARDNHIFDFIKDHLKLIREVQQQDQKYQREYRKIKHTIETIPKEKIQKHKPKRKIAVITPAICPPQTKKQKQCVYYSSK